MSCFRPKTLDDDVGNGKVQSEKHKNNAKTESPNDIEKKLKKEKKQMALTHRIPVVGAGESGKSTLIKQMQILYINGFGDDDRRSKVPDIRRNIRDAMLSITGAMHRINPPIDLEHSEHQVMVDYIQNDSIKEGFDYPSEFFDYCIKLWKDKGVMESFSRCNEYQLIDSAKWFLDKCADVAKSDFLPDDQDILRCRVLTSGIYETKFQVGKVMFHMFDVGGQRDERRKWIQVFHDITAVIFVCACSGYDTMLREDPTQNRLKESLELFTTIWNNRYLRQNSIILFLNKQDLFQEKIKKAKTRLEDYFKEFSNFPQPAPDPEDPNCEPEVNRAKAFVRDQFLRISDKNSGDSQRRCYSHYTTAVDTENIRRVFADCQNILQRAYMQKFGLL